METSHCDWCTQYEAEYKLRSLDKSRGHSARERGEESETDEAIPTGRFPGASPQSTKSQPLRSLPDPVKTADEPKEAKSGNQTRRTKE